MENSLCYAQPRHGHNLFTEAYVVLGEPCASSGPASNALRGLKVNIAMKHIWWSLGPRLQSSKIVIIQWFWSASDDLLTNDAIILSWDFLSSLCYGNCFYTQQIEELHNYAVVSEGENVGY